jgi:hypothetical protein
MAEVPRIVRGRLRGQVVTGEHPDANLLSAFAERTLADPERAQMLDHLSRCADCREVVALSTPQVEEEQLVAAAGRASTSGRSWWRSPIVHWSALMAAALVVLIAVGERMRLREGYSASAPAIASYGTADKQAGPAPAQSPAEPKESQKAEPSPASRPAGAVNRQRAAGAGGASVARNGPVAANAAAPAAPAPPPPLEAKKLQSSPATDYSGGQAYDQARKIDQPQLKALPVPLMKAPGAARTGGNVAGSPVDRESKIVAESSAGNLVRRASVGPRWSVSDSGAVQRSFDSGRSWKEVAIAEGVSFRAVAVMVNDIWAGGAGGALFHSTDGGEHWARVEVRAGDRSLSGDILRVEFADTRNIVITTSTGESWTSSDAGATWLPK